ncbi:hypothetical protein, partial [Vibrio cholerae]|uniref:hypothetical protein n=1 Tax=Vibrio cholerae TaxID=666 RepID=UPI001F23DF6C
MSQVSQEVSCIRNAVLEISTCKEWKISSMKHLWLKNTERQFHGELEKVEKRNKDPLFQPNFSVESNADHRTKLLKNLASKR